MKSLIGKRSKLLLFAFVLSTVLSEIASAQTYPYALTDLGTLPGGFWSEARGINNSGQVVGNTVVDSVSRAFIYANGQMMDLGLLPGGRYTTAFAINESGVVVGGAETESLEHHQFQPSTRVNAFRYQNGALEDLGTLPGTGNTQFSHDNRLSTSAYAVNDAGTAVGISRGNVMIYEDGVMRGLNKEGAQEALGINNLGQIVGLARSSNSSSATYHAFLMTGNSLIDLGALDDQGFSYATAINEVGTIVGGSQTASGVMRPFVYEAGVMRNLGTLPGQVGCVAMAINNNGTVVGGCDTIPFIYKDGVMSDLTELAPPGFQLYLATGINDGGQIVGIGFNSEGMQRGFLLTPAQ